MELQAPHHVLLIRPASFGSNPETIDSNAFQHEQDLSNERLQLLALQEFDTMIDVLNDNHIQSIVIPDTQAPVKPDAIFPNNWVSMQPDGKVVTYPMLAPNRRLERRPDVVELLNNSFIVKEILDFSAFENQGEIVEGTGSLIFDHANKIAYAARSPRTSERIARVICDKLGYTLIVFDATDEAGKAIYHTNVMMAIATKFAIVCLDSIRIETELNSLLDSFESTGHQVIAISFEQMNSFAGNVLEVLNSRNEPLLIISEAAVQSLLPGQLDAITKFVDIVPISIPMIEKYSGGSVRCMMAGIHLAQKKSN